MSTSSVFKESSTVSMVSRIHYVCFIFFWFCYHKSLLCCVYFPIIATDDVIGKCISGDEGDINIPTK